MLVALPVLALLAAVVLARPPLAANPTFLGNPSFKNWTLTAQNNAGYAVRTTMGEPAQQLRMQIGFGTPYISTPSVDCVSDSPAYPSCQDGVVGFDASKSSTFVNVSSVANGSSVDLNLGAQTARAALASEFCTAQGATPADTYIYPNQTVAIASEAAGLYLFDGSQGVLGFGTRIPQFEDSLVGHRIANGSLNSFTVGFNLDRTNFNTGTTVSQDAGQINWAGVNRALAPGDSFTWLEVVDNSTSSEEWVVHLDGMSFGDKDLTLNGGDRDFAIIEPYFSFLTLPHAVTDQIFGSNGLDLTQEQGYWPVPCDAQYNVSFTLGDHVFDMDIQDLIIQNNATSCISSIINWNSQDITSFYRLGAPFFRSVYVALVFPGQNETADVPQALGLSQKPITTASSSPASGKGGGGGTNVGAIVGGVVGGVVGLALLGAIAFFLLRRRKHKRAEREAELVSHDPAVGPQMANKINGQQQSLLSSAQGPAFSPPPTYPSQQHQPARFSQFPQPQEDDVLDAGESQFVDIPAAGIPRVSTPLRIPPRAAGPPLDRFGNPLPQVD